MKRTLLLVTTVLIVVAFAMPQAGGAAQQRAAQQANKGKPPKDPEPVLSANLAFDDNFFFDLHVNGETIIPTRLISDGWQRTVADEDGDTYLELKTEVDQNGIVYYQDSRITFAQSGIHPDPCTHINFGSSGIMVRTRLNKGKCSIETPVY